MHTTSIQPNENSHQPGLVARMLCTAISVLVHPVFVPLYVTAFLLYLHPTAFVGFSAFNKTRTLIIVALNITFYPMLTILLLKWLGFIESMLLKTQKDRIIPYIASGIFFFWSYTVFKQQSAYPLLMSAYMLGLFLASSGALLANIYLKVSMHAIGMGTWLGFFLMLMKHNSMLMSGPLFALILLTGIVCTARLILNSHRPLEIYVGLGLGMLAALVGYAFVM